MVLNRRCDSIKWHACSKIVSAAGMNYHASCFHRDSSRDKSLIGIALLFPCHKVSSPISMFIYYLVLVDPFLMQMKHYRVYWNMQWHAIMQKQKFSATIECMGTSARRFLLHERASRIGPAEMVTKKTIWTWKKAILRTYHATGGKVNNLLMHRSVESYEKHRKQMIVFHTMRQ